MPWVRLTEWEDLRQRFTAMHLGQYLSFLICRTSINLPLHEVIAGQQRTRDVRGSNDNHPCTGAGGTGWPTCPRPPFRTHRPCPPFPPAPTTKALT